MMASGEANHPAGGQQLDLAVYPLQPKRVPRAWDYRRRKRIKCSAGQRPCMNCLLYHAACTDSTPVSSRVQKPKRYNQLPTLVARDESRNSRARAVEDLLEGGEESPQPGRLTPTVVSLEDAQVVQPLTHDADGDLAQDFLPVDQGTVPRVAEITSSSESWDSQLYASNIFDFPASPNMNELTSAMLADFAQFHAGLQESHQRSPTPCTAEAEGATRPPSSNTRQPNVAGVHFLKNGLLLGKSVSLLPGLFLKKDAGESRFQGLNSIGATLSSCLIYARNHSPDIGEHRLLQYLIHGIAYMDEANIAGPPRIESQDLPDRSLVEHGVELFFKTIYLRYPIVSPDLRHSWIEWYEDSERPPHLIQFLCVCIMVAIGITAHPKPPTEEVQEKVTAMHQRAWSCMDYVLAHPYTGSVQVVLLNTVYLTQQGKLGIAWSTCGIALRMAQSIGLHRHTPSDLQLNNELVRLRARIWWVAYSLDAFLSLCEGRPTGTSSDTTDTKIEPLTAQECPGDSEKAPGPMIYAWHVSLARLINEITSVIGRERGANERLHCLADLDIKLLNWRDSIPLEFRPEQENLAPPHMHHHVSWLHLQFFNVSRTLHWTSMLLAHMRDDSFPSDKYPRLQSSEAICVESARSLIRTSNKSSVASGVQEIRALGAPSAYFLAATAAVIFMYILKEPQRLSAAADVEYLRAGIYHLTSEFYATQVGQGQEILIHMLHIAETVTKPLRSINGVLNG